MPERISERAARATIAALSPEKRFSGKKMLGFLGFFKAILFRSSSLALTPPAMTTLFTSGYFLRARESFSIRMSTAVLWKLAAKSATCSGERRFFISWDG